MDRHNHYEVAFEAYLQAQQWCYIAVAETRRAWMGTERIKNLDFILTAGGGHWLVDVKGRHYPAGAPGKRRRVWESWSTQDDITGLRRWQDLFGPGFAGLLVFAYYLLPEVVLTERVPDLWTWQGRRYLFRAVPVEDYQGAMRLRSRRWGTVFVPSAAFRQLARPLEQILQQTPAPLATSSV
jgi:hypothetical protein